VTPPAIATSWIEVDLGAITHNLQVIRSAVGPHVRVLAVVKANAYGHGAADVARAALSAGAAGCAVANLEEAIVLRQSGLSGLILVTGFTPGELAREALQHDVTVTVFDPAVARVFSCAAVTLQQPARIHVKIDTGLGRLGVLPDQADAALEAIAGLPGVLVDGLFTHFSSADSDAACTREQIARFLPFVRRHGAGRLVHAGNSAGALAYPEARFDAVRPGLAMYGMNPFAPARAGPDGRPLAVLDRLRPALAWKAHLSVVKELPDGHGVSYGARYRCQGERRVASVPVGYGDGFRRTPHRAGVVLVRGMRAPIVGQVCMDQIMIDVTHIAGAQAGDEVVILGEQGAERITAEDLAARLGTVNYEVTTAISARPPRRFLCAR
jgi:alanine racemase